MNTYNPITRAASAAWAELTTPEAIQWYSDRAWSDTLTTWAALGNLCRMIIALGAMCRQLTESAQSQSVQPIPPASVPLLPAVKIAGYLSPQALTDSVSEDEQVPAQPQVDYERLTVAQLRDLCTSRGIKWRKANRGKHLSKSQTLTLLDG